MSDPFIGISTAQLAAAHIQLMQQKETIEAVHKAAMEEETKGIADQLRVLYYEIQKRMQQEKIHALDTNVGKVLLKTTVEYNVQDLNAWGDFIVTSQDLSFFSKSISKPRVEAYRKQHGDALPPGLKAFTRQHIQFKPVK
ncbi:hypothetical protein [Xenorhabdus innexi]|uniref:Uncharacterized protein n=1 Tax=Xenorhabdus innexi TaxID=290109 RepID=A0A1N6MWR7_9GAMM|nr:hypothetical protein [Xenorhabdus innexi]PHM35976.1 hypothetical protein Xinn_02046 [Xenorhabdus innexi]SIP73276.1 hypothetical protein XIS1_1790082 [Xenorhabdus innexi]